MPREAVHCDVIVVTVVVHAAVSTGRQMQWSDCLSVWLCDRERQVSVGTRNLTRKEATRRAELLRVLSYDVELDLTDTAGGRGGRTFRSRTEVTFGCATPGASTFIEAAADALHRVTLNGKPVDTTGFS